MTELPPDLAELVGDEQYLTTGQFARVLRISKMTVLRMIAAGEIRAERLRPTSPHRIARSELLRVLETSHARSPETGH